MNNCVLNVEKLDTPKRQNAGALLQCAKMRKLIVQHIKKFAGQNFNVVALFKLAKAFGVSVTDILNK